MTPTASSVDDGDCDCDRRPTPALTGRYLFPDDTLPIVWDGAIHGCVITWGAGGGNNSGHKAGGDRNNQKLPTVINPFTPRLPTLGPIWASTKSQLLGF